MKKYILVPLAYVWSWVTNFSPVDPILLLCLFFPGKPEDNWNDDFCS